jgi:hypothetical protein
LRCSESFDNLNATDLNLKQISAHLYGIVKKFGVKGITKFALNRESWQRSLGSALSIRLTFRPRPDPALQGRDKGALKVNLEQAPAFRPEKAEGLTY